MSRFENGWIKIHRKMFAGDISHNVYCMGIWIALLSMATWKESKIMWHGKQRSLPPGTVVFGYSELAKKWDCSPNTIKRWVKYLHDSGRIVHEVCTHGCIATICNWDTYQASEETVCTIAANELQTNCKRTANEVQLNEEVQEEKKNTHIVHSVFDLDSIYSKYPKKAGKSRGMRALKSQIRTQADYDALSLAVDRYRTCDEVLRGFIKHWSTFAGEWRDWTAQDAGQSILPTNTPKQQTFEEIQNEARQRISSNLAKANQGGGAPGNHGDAKPGQSNNTSGLANVQPSLWRVS